MTKALNKIVFHDLPVNKITFDELNQNLKINVLFLYSLYIL